MLDHFEAIFSGNLGSDSGNDWQCDQMIKLLFHNLAIYNTENLPNTYNTFAKVDKKFVEC